MGMRVGVIIDGREFQDKILQSLSQKSLKGAKSALVLALILHIHISDLSKRSGQINLKNKAFWHSWGNKKYFQF